MPTITLPDFWVLFDPEGYADGSHVAVRLDGTIAAATAEDAWKKFTPLKRDRDREAKEGWRVVGVTQEDWRAYWDRERRIEPESPPDV